jgi:hypothetical protein
MSGFPLWVVPWATLFHRDRQAHPLAALGPYAHPERGESPAVRVQDLDCSGRFEGVGRGVLHRRRVVSQERLRGGWAGSIDWQRGTPVRRQPLGSGDPRARNANMWKSGMWICTLIVPAIPAAAALAGETVCACTADTSIASSHGFEGPVATARLKAKRRAEQDIELMNMLATQPGWNRNRVARAVAAAVNLTSSTKAQGADDPGRTSFEGVHAADLAKIRYALTQEILAYSGQRQRVHVDGLFSSIDVAPTVLELLGIDSPRQMDGLPRRLWSKAALGAGMWR